MVWKNNDGLHIKFGNEKAELVTGGVQVDGPEHVLEIKVNGEDIPSVAGSIVGRSDGLIGLAIPSGVMLASVELFAEEAVTSSGGTATLSVGIKKQDDTEYDYDGIVAALDVDNATAGSGLGTIGNRLFLTQGSTGHGALIGTITTNAGYLCMNYGTEAITGGVIVLRLRYYRPRSTNGSVI